MALVAMSCADPSSPATPNDDAKAPPVSTRTNPILYPNVQIGDGFNPGTPAVPPDGAAICLGESVLNENLANQTEYHAFYAFSAVEARTRFLEFVRPKSTDPTLPDTLESFINKLSNNSDPMLILAIRVDTHQDRIGPNIDASFCQEASSSLADFVQKCGTQYLEKNTYGGYIFLAARLSGSVMSNEQYHELNNIIQPYMEHTDLSAADMMTALGSTVSSTFQMEWTVWGLPQPVPNPLTPADWADYQALALYPGNFGVNELTDQTFKNYGAGLLSSCGLSEDEDVRKALDCYGNFNSANRNPKKNTRFAPILENIDWVLNSADSSRVVWGDPIDDPALWQSYYDELTTCLSDDPGISPIASKEGDCDGAINAGVNGLPYVCTYCEIDPSCDSSYLYREFTRLPTYTLLPVTQWTPDPVPAARPPAEPFSVGNDTSKSMRNLSSHICVLGSLQGKMVGTGEGAFAEPNGAD